MRVDWLDLDRNSGEIVADLYLSTVLGGPQTGWSQHAGWVVHRSYDQSVLYCFPLYVIGLYQVLADVTRHLITSLLTTNV